MRQMAVTGPRSGVWIVDAPTDRRERTKGLRGRGLRSGEGLLLERCRSVHTMGMRYPITVAFLDRSWHVIRVDRSPAGRILFCLRARHVLECHIGADMRLGDVLSELPTWPRYTLAAAPLRP
jgi:uncharacterized protein